MTFDPTGDSLWTVNASYGKYIAGLANNIADSGSNGGVASTFQYEYLGPAINTDATAPTSSLIPTDEALRTLWAWFNANGGTDRPVVGVDIPGVNNRVGDGLKSPSVHEVTGGVTRQIGSRGMVRVDGVYRSWTDFYFSRRDTGTSYHLAVTIDDALQGINLVVRGEDLFPSTHIHRLLQALLGLPTP